MRLWIKNTLLSMIIISAATTFSAAASGSRVGGKQAQDCSAVALPLGARPVDRATVMRTMDNVQTCFAEQAASPGSSRRFELTILLLVIVGAAALTIAGLIFWDAKYMRSISLPLAIGIAILSTIAAASVDDHPRDQAAARQSRLQQARWHWTVRMTRSNQMSQDAAAIDEAVAATNEFVATALDGR
jgi:hypothetical protein